MPRKLSPEQEQRIIEAYMQQRSATKAGRLEGVGSSTVYRVLARHGVELRQDNARQLFDADAEAEIAKRYASGETAPALARELGCSVTTIREAVRRQGGAVRSRGNVFRQFTDEQVQQIISLWQQGVSQTAIAQAIGSSQITMSRVLRHHGFRDEARRPVGERHGSWKGGRVGMPGGYIGILVQPDDPMASMRNSVGYVLEHRLVMARQLGRPLTPGETVHHKDGDRQNNDPSNLQLRNGQHGKGAVLRCADCGSHNVEGAEI